ncbi:MAG: AraC family transcriptional regulator [Clostridia bacterium]|nr:AraC family transcriptional regulator [Clostridia bacterium]
MPQTAFVPFDGVFIDYIKNTEKNNMRAQHYHDAYEIYLQISGERYLFHADICYNLKRGDLVIFQPFDIHYTESHEINYYERYVMNFKSECLSDFLSQSELHILFSKLESCVIHLDDIQTKELCTYFEKANFFFKKGGFLSEKLLSSVIFQMVALISDLIETAQYVENRHIQPELLEAISYINTHYAENITLEMVSNTIHMSKYHFCRLFRRATGATFVEYLSNIRLVKVHRLLAETKLTLNEIASKTGFSSASALTRVFKNTYKISPREFRKNTKVSH